MRLKGFSATMLTAAILLTSAYVSYKFTYAKEEEPNASIVYNESNYNKEFALGRVIVVLKDEYADSVDKLEDLSSVNSVEKLTKGKRYSSKFSGRGKHLALVNLKKRGRQDVIDAIKKLKEDPRIKYVEPDYKLKLDRIPNDTDFGKLYGMEKISAPQAWDRFTGSASVVVGVIDSGINYNHPDLKSNVWINAKEIPDNAIDDDNNGYIDDVYGWDFLNNDNDPMDDNGHGTHCAGIIAGTGDNELGVAGVSWNTKVAALKFTGSNGKGDTSNAIKALNYAKTNGISITNNSWGGVIYSQALKDSIEENGNLFITSAGNNGTLDTEKVPYYPACLDCDNIISVAASDSNDDLSIFSHYGKKFIDIAAPGENIWSCSLGNGYQYLSGSSMAAPFVAGAAALFKGRNPNISVRDLKNRILDSVDPIPQLADKIATGGRLNIKRMLTPNIVLSSPEKGDVDEDGIVTVFDYILIKNHILEKGELPESIINLADINDDGSISSLDLAIVKIVLLGL